MASQDALPLPQELGTSQLKMSQLKWLADQTGRATVVWSPFGQSTFCPVWILRHGLN